MRQKGPGRSDSNTLNLSRTGTNMEGARRRPAGCASPSRPTHLPAGRWVEEVSKARRPSLTLSPTITVNQLPYPEVV